MSEESVMKALCIRADSALFRVGESYDVVRVDTLLDTAHVATGNFFNDILVCAFMYEGELCGARVEKEENVYIFELCERRQKRESKSNTEE